MSLCLWGTGKLSNGDIDAYVTNITIANNLVAKTAIFTAVSFTSITTAALTVSRSAPSIIINDTTTAQAATLGVAAVSGDFFTGQTTPGDLAIKANSGGRAVWLGTGSTATVSITSSGLQASNIGTSGSLSTATINMLGDATINQTRGPGSTIIGMATGNGSICANSAPNDSCIAASQKLVIAASLTYVNGPAIVTGNISCGGGYIGSNIALDSVSIPALSLSRAGAGQCVFGMSEGTNSLINGSVANDLCVVSGRALRLRASPGQYVVSKSRILATNPTDNGNGSVEFGIAGAAAQVFPLASAEDTVIRASNSMYIGSPGNQLRLYGADVWYYNDAIQGGFNWGRLRLKPGQNIGNASISTVYFDDTIHEFVGQRFSINYATGVITNNTGSNVVISAQYSARRGSNGFGADQCWFATTLNSERYGWGRVSALDSFSGAGTFNLQADNTWGLRWYQDAGDTVPINNQDSDTYFYLTYTWQKVGTIST